MDYWTKVQQRWDSVIGNYNSLEFEINGHQLTPMEIDSFKRLTGLVMLEPGRYWLDPNSGNMGVEGDSIPRMNIFQNPPPQASTAVQVRPSLSGRRQLFSSADLTGIWRVE